MTENNNSDTPVARQEVLITGIEVPFWDAVGILIWWALAAIPAVLILSVIFGVAGLVLGGLFGSI